MEPCRTMSTTQEETNYPEIAGTLLGQMINVERMTHRIIRLKQDDLLDEKELLKELLFVAEYSQKSILGAEQKLSKTRNQKPKTNTKL